MGDRGNFRWLGRVYIPSIAWESKATGSGSEGERADPDEYDPAALD